MLLATFSLKEMPFQKNVPSKQVFYNEQYREMKSRLLFLAENMGIGLFTGEVGSGKSTMLRTAAEELNPQLYRKVYLHKGIEKLSTFYSQIAHGLGIQPKYRQSEVMQQVTSTLAELYTNQKIKTVIIIDEAHLLKAEILDEIRLLHNAEMDSLDYLATAIVGQPPLLKMMGLMRFLPLAQRIVVSYQLSPLSREDAYNYFEHHLKIAGASSSKKIFKDNAAETVINAAKGIPRMINSIALKAMYAADQNKMTTVDQECVMTALGEMGLK